MTRSIKNFLCLCTCAVSLGLLPLAGCSSLRGTPEHAADEGVPAAKPLNAETARTLYLIIVDSLHRDGRSRAALAFLDEYERVYPHDRKAMMLRADCLVDIARNADADVIYRQLLSGDGAAAAYAGLGRIAASKADWPAAALEFRHASERNAANTAYLNDLGFAQVSAGTYGDALASLRQALELDPDNRMIRNNLILALHLSGGDAEARAMVGRITQPDDRKRAKDLLDLTAAGLRQAAAGQTKVADTGAPAKEIKR